MKLECAAMALQLAAADHTTSGLAAPARRHAESCLRCQAELASYRKLKRSLAGLRSVALDTDDRFVDDLLSSIRPTAPVHSLQRGSRRRAYLGGVAAALTAASAGAVVLVARLTARSALAG